MFLFITVLWTLLLFAPQFKYISCSYLSGKSQLQEMLYLEFKYISCSYLSGLFFMHFFIKTLFKYISCSYLSVFIQFLVFLHHLFKYISCSYLSLLPLLLALHPPHLNTSHVLIYQYRHKLQERSKKFKYISCSYLST